MTDVLSLGDIVPVDFIQPGDVVRPAEPLTLAQCSLCDLVQLRHSIDRDSLYRQYWYKSGLNPTMVTALQNVVDGVRERVPLLANDTVIDIGANDGTLLQLYTEDVQKIGVDPARNLIDSVLDVCDIFVNDYFETSDVELPVAKVITSIAMFYDLDEPRKFVQRIADLLHREGVWVMQMTDLVQMLRSTAFDNICHEHVCYYSIGVFKRLVEDYGLEIFDVEFNDVNGASVRSYVGWRGAHAVSPRVDDALVDEATYLGDAAIEKFRERVNVAREKVVSFIQSAREEGKRVHVLGASTKGNTLLQYFGLSVNEIDMAADVSTAKHGLLMAASNIPIVAEEESVQAAPDYYLVLPWHFIDFFLSKRADYLGVGMLVPLPQPRLYLDDARDL